MNSIMTQFKREVDYRQAFDGRPLSPSPSVPISSNTLSNNHKIYRQHHEEHRNAPEISQARRRNKQRVLPTASPRRHNGNRVKSAEAQGPIDLIQAEIVGFLSHGRPTLFKLLT